MSLLVVAYNIGVSDVQNLRPHDLRADLQELANSGTDVICLQEVGPNRPSANGAVIDMPKFLQDLSPVFADIVGFSCIVPCSVSAGFIKSNTSQTYC